MMINSLSATSPKQISFVSFMRLFCLSLLIIAAIAIPALAADEVPAGQDYYKSSRQELHSMTLTVEALEKRLVVQTPLSNTNLGDIKVGLDAVEAKLAILKVGITGRIETTSASLATLSQGAKTTDTAPAAPPGNSLGLSGVTDSAGVATETVAGGVRDSVSSARQALSDELAGLELLMIDIKALETRLTSAQLTLSRLRREKFSLELFSRVSLTPQLISSFSDDLDKLINSVNTNLTLWVNFIFDQRLQEAALLFSLALGSSILVWITIILTIDRAFSLRLKAGQDDFSIGIYQKVGRIFVRTLKPTLSSAIFFTLFIYLFRDNGLITLRVSDLFSSAAFIIFKLIVFEALVFAIFMPKNPSYRLLYGLQKGNGLICFLVMMLFLILQSGALVEAVIGIYSTSLLLTQVFEAVIVFLLVIVMTALGVVLSRSMPVGSGRFMSFIRFFLPRLLYLISLGELLLLALGYLGLARFITQVFLDSAGLMMPILLMFFMALYFRKPSLIAQTALGQFLIRKELVQAGMIDTFASVVGFALAFMVLICGLPLLILPWDFAFAVVLDFYKAIFTGFSVAGFEISIANILVGTTFFAFGLVLTRFLQRWFYRYASAAKIDSGVRDSIQRGMGYVGYSIAIMVGLNAMGTDLSNIALVAGALSVGIGFGLQNIFNNFVSGIILLIERPIKVGDWVVIGGYEGTIKNIAVRATQLETFDGQTVFVPNSDLINSSVSNWNYGNKRGRIAIAVVVDNAVDPREVEALLVSIGKDHPRALKDPAPYVYFKDLNGSSCSFELRVYIYDIDYSLSSMTELRFAIFEAFKAKGIDLMLKDMIDISFRDKRGGDHLISDDLAPAVGIRGDLPSQSVPQRVVTRRQESGDNGD